MNQHTTTGGGEGRLRSSSTCGKHVYTSYSSFERQRLGRGFSQWSSCVMAEGHEGECTDHESARGNRR